MPDRSRGGVLWETVEWIAPFQKFQDTSKQEWSPKMRCVFMHFMDILSNSPLSLFIPACSLIQFPKLTKVSLFSGQWWIQTLKADQNTKRSVECSATNCYLYHLPKGQGPLRKRGYKDGKSQKSGRPRSKPCLPGLTPLWSWTHSSCRCLHTTCKWSSQSINILQWRDRSWWVSPPKLKHFAQLMVPGEGRFRVFQVHGPLKKVGHAPAHGLTPRNVWAAQVGL